MKYFDKVPAILLLEDGTYYEGLSAGKIGTTTGELCFTTGMTGYQEVFTDPSFFGQILVMTSDHIGNYGAKKSESESDSIKINGLVCRNFTNLYSRHLADSSIQEYLLEENLIGISGVDTRAVVRHIRDKGAMNCIISSETQDIEALKSKLKEVPSMAGLELSSKVCTKSSYYYGNPDAKYKIAALDLGIKKNILRCFDNRDCYIKVFPANTGHQEMSEWNPNGYFISNGPGDPSAMPYAVETVQAIFDEDKPVFGICLGQQIMALAAGLSTYKMHHGHRGLNHPVKNLKTSKCEITTQNHGFGVDPESIKNSDRVEATHINLNDQTIEGLRFVNKKAFSVQYHPEAAPGPHDSRYLFDEYIELLNS